jgi:large repetitive protein
MEGNGSSDRNYTMRLSLPEFTTTAMSFNTVVSGSIVKAGEQDTYTFNGVAGQHLFYDALGGDGFTRRLYDPSGKLVSSYPEDSRNDIGPDYYTLSATGTYKVVIDGNNNATGNYKFRLLDSSVATPITLGTEITGTFDQNGLGTTAYKFSATAGQHLYLNTGAGQAPNAWIVYGINGQYLGSGSIQDNGYGYYYYYPDDQEFDITVTGEYLLYIQGNGAASTNYKFTLTDSQFTTNSLVVGNTISGTIAKQGQQNTYTFSGNAGEQLQFDVLNRSDYITNTARLYNQIGTEIFSRNFYNSDAADLIVLKETGSYRLVIDGSKASTDAYSFRLLNVKASATDINLDTDVTGQLTSGQETKFYQFTGSQGQKLYLDWLSSSPNTQWSLYNSAGHLLDNRGVSDYETTLANNDTYTIAVRGYNDGVVDYGFRLITPDLTTTPINVSGNTSAVVSGTIAERGEVDIYTFTGKFGQQLVFDKQAIDPNISLRIYTPVGVEVNADSLLTLAEAGTYRIVVNGNSGTIGNYAFRLLDKADATLITFNTEISGTFGSSKLDNNIYRFSGIKGQHFYLNIGDGDYNNKWTLYTPSGTVLNSGDLAGYYVTDAEFDLPSMGEYLLVFSGNKAANNNYKFTLAAPDLETKSLELGTATTGSIIKFGESDTYLFSGSIGQKLFFDVVSGITGIHGRLYSPTGYLVADLTSINAATAVTLTEKGTYKVIVDGDREITGNYSFLVSDRANATELLLNEPITGQLAANGTPQLFTLNGNVGQILRFDINDADVSKVKWILYGDGDQILN